MVRLVIEGLRRCFGLVRGVQVSQTGIRYPGPIACVTSRVRVALQSVTSIRRVSEAPTEDVLSSGVKSPPEKALGHFPGYDLRLLSPVTIYCGWSSAQMCPQAVVLVYTNISSSPQKRSKKISEDTTLEIKSARIKCSGRNVSGLSCALYSH